MTAIVDSFQDPLNMLEKYPDWSREGSENDAIYQWRQRRQQQAEVLFAVLESSTTTGQQPFHVTRRPNLQPLDIPGQVPTLLNHLL